MYTESFSGKSIALFMYYSTYMLKIKPKADTIQQRSFTVLQIK